MNDRIKAAWETARHNARRQQLVDPEFMEEFAELIVNECAAYLNGAMEVHNQPEQDLCDHAARKIKEHFGVSNDKANA